jgi:hypothetical protein
MIDKSINPYQLEGVSQQRDMAFHHFWKHDANFSHLASEIIILTQTELFSKLD